jgi:prevent-host-death family protein
MANPPVLRAIARKPIEVAPRLSGELDGLAKDPLMSIFTIHQAKTNLSRLIQKASEGEEVIIARGSKPVARVVPVG